MTDEIHRGYKNSMIKKFEVEVFDFYKEMGSELRDFVWNKEDINEVTDFLGYTCHLDQFHVGDWIENLGELKADVKKRHKKAKIAAAGLGDNTDRLLVNTLTWSDAKSVECNYGLGLDEVNEGLDLLTGMNTPNDGQRFALVGGEQWKELSKIEAFAETPYVRDVTSIHGKYWQKTLWMPHSGLHKSGRIRHCLLWYREAIGHAIGSEVDIDLIRHKDMKAHHINYVMDQGACVISKDGIVILKCIEEI